MKQRKNIFLSFILILLLINITGCKSKDTETYSLFENNNVKSKFKTEDTNFQIYDEDKWDTFLIKSITVNNYFPDIEKPTEDYFYNQIELISKTNANTIKVDELLQPEFYNALYKFNENNHNKIYLIQSITMDTQNLEVNPDPFKLDNMVPYKDKISTYISAIHGDVTIPIKEVNNKEFGGKYTKDVSKYTLSYILGSKWNVDVIKTTNETRTDKEDLDSIFLATKNAKPFEVFLANCLEHAIGYERDKYSYHTPVSILNTPRTDILNQAYNTNPNDNLVSIDPNVIVPKNEHISYFVSYEIFPYEPDFLNLNPKYTKYIDHRGNTNNYAGYLNDLITKHEIPVFISDFGIPSSRGISSISTSNKNKGKNSEKEQGEILVSMFEDIIYQKAIGASIYSWQDNFGNNLWLDRQNPNQNFGIITFEDKPDYFNMTEKELKKEIDTPNYISEKNSDDIIDSIIINSDFKNIYLDIKYKNIESYKDINTTIGVNITNEFGSNVMTSDIKSNLLNNFLININLSSQIDSKILVHSYYDLYNYKYSVLNEFLEKNEEYNNKNNNIYNPIYTLISEPYTDNVTGNKLPAINYETGQLSGKIISGDKKSDSSFYISSLDDYIYNEKDNTLRIRIPWNLINFANPSQKEVYDDFRQFNNVDATKKIDKLSFTFLNIDRAGNLSSTGNIDNKTLKHSIQYTWNDWDKLDLRIRKKESFSILEQFFK